MADEAGYGDRGRVSPGLEEMVRLGVRCRLAGGHPIYRTKLIRPLEDRVWFACLGASDVVRGGIIEGIPKEVMDRLEESHRDWVMLNQRYPDLVRRIYAEESARVERRTIV